MQDNDNIILKYSFGTLIWSLQSLSIFNVFKSEVEII